MVDFWANWVRQYPIVSIEDGLAEDDWEGWKLLTEELGRQVQLVGDDLFVTNTERLQQGIEQRRRQLDPDQGEPDRHGDRDAGRDRAGAPLRLHVSHLAPLGRDGRHVYRRPRGGDRAGQIKTGSAGRTDRIAKYNQLLRIEEELGQTAEFLGRKP